MNKEEVAELMGVAPKHMKRFTMTTPEGRVVDGWICKSRGHAMGSLYIETVDGRDTGQFVQGMPKLKYLDTRFEPEEIPSVRLKEDGTNIVAYPLRVNGMMVELLFKTRGLPIAEPDFLNMIQEAMTPELEDTIRIVTSEGISFSFELIGGKNIHEIPYTKFENEDFSKPRLVALCAFHEDDGLIYTSRNFEDLCESFGMEYAMEVFEIIKEGDKYIARATPEFLERYWKYAKHIPDVFANETLIGLYHDMESYFEKINIEFQKEHEGKMIIEGAVWQIDRTLSKCKAISVREGHIKNACGIPTHDIRKALFKLQENPIEGKELEDTPIEDVIQFVQEELTEEYPQDMVMEANTINKIKGALGRFLRKVEITEELQTIIKRIHNEIPETADTADKMRVFAELYPDKRKFSGKVYQALEAS